MIKTILNVICLFAFVVSFAGISVMIAKNFADNKKDADSFFLVGAIYTFAGLILQIACTVFAYQNNLC